MRRDLSTRSSPSSMEYVYVYSFFEAPHTAETTAAAAAAAAAHLGLTTYIFSHISSRTRNFFVSSVQHSS